MLAAIALGMVSSLAVLVVRLPLHKDPPVELLRRRRRSG